VFFSIFGSTLSTEPMRANWAWLAASLAPSCPVNLISVGAGREQTIEVKPIL